ncbi:MAG: type VI secretion system tip protein VgrG [Gemmataceae bacterium]|nr:type VI secretion system tip protein VgrG [Gemmataceae bacterium]
MPEPTQTGRPIAVTTPLGPDKILITGFQADEAISELFRYTIDGIAKSNANIAFDSLLGQSITVKFVSMASNSPIRYCNGICRSLTLGESDGEWSRWRMEVVPKVWTLTKVTRSRIFQQLTVIDILKKVLTGIDTSYEAQGTFQPRDYCVQYRESDWNFASRLMEEEGIHYFFKHSDGAHKLVITGPGSSPDVPAPSTLTYKNVAQAPTADEEFIYEWGKTQELTAGKVTLWDHCFESPNENYESKANIPTTLQTGKVSHKLNVGNDSLELYDYPGEFAQRFDGVDPGGAERAADVGKIGTDGTRTVKIRANAESALAVIGKGISTCRQITPGHKFTLKTLSDDPVHKDLKPDGSYIVVSVSHTAVVQDDYRSSGQEGFSYQNSFTVIPAAAVYAPPRRTAKPVVAGSQTGTVVGPSGEEIFTDKYGRIKVQFHWDREGKKNASSSCWLRVSTPWAGRQWGMFHLPRIGQEVVIDFLEGDPDQPIVTGSVYNANQMPAYTLPDNKTRSWIKSNSSMGGEGYNEIRFEDKKSAEQIFMHGQKNLDIRIQNDCMEAIMHDRHLIVGIEKDGAKQGTQFEEVLVDRNLKLHKNHTEIIGGDMKLLVGTVDGDGNQDIVISKDQKVLVKGNAHLKISTAQNIEVTGKASAKYKADHVTLVEGSQSLEVKNASKVKYSDKASWTVTDEIAWKGNAGFSLETAGDIAQKTAANFAVEAAAAMHLKANSGLVIECSAGITLKCGGNFVCITPAGVDIQGSITKINSGGAPSSGAGCSPKSPESPDAPDAAADAAEAAPTLPTQADNSVTGHKSCN